MLPFMEKAREDEGLDMIFFMLTNILTETTELLCVGQGAAQVVADAFHVGDANEEPKQTATLPGIVSYGKSSDSSCRAERSDGKEGYHDICISGGFYA